MTVPGVDHTHDPALTSWVDSANGHADFPIQNLPFGVFSPLAGAPRGGVAIGDMILDLRALHDDTLLDDEAQAAVHACIGPSLNAFMAMGAGPRAALRDAVSALLADGADPRPHLLHRAADCILYLPAHVGDYSDFYAGIHHAENVGRLMRPDTPLLPNYKWLPIGYHGRASSIRPSGPGGSEVRRPKGQRKPASESEPSYGPSRNLDYELELGVWIGPGNALGTTIPITEASGHIAGYCLLNDWSARDIQGWEYQPLGPFQAKSFCTTVSPWIITPEALAPFRAPQPPRPSGDPAPLPYLHDPVDQAVGALDLERALTRGEKAFEPGLLARANRGFLYIDEVNLLEDHLVDLLIDVAASGENVVEREGLSVRHPARFVLVGSGNPEEGELRPQLLDRFGLSVEVRTPDDVPSRIAIVRRRDSFDRDRGAFLAEWAAEDMACRGRIEAGRAMLPDVAVDDAVLEQATRLCMSLGTDGLRAELTLLRAARALAALDGVDAVAVSHLLRVAPSALRHRLRRDPLDDAGSTARVARAVADQFGA